MTRDLLLIKNILSSFMIVLLGLISCGCVSEAAAPTATFTVEPLAATNTTIPTATPTATFTLTPSATPTLEPTPTDTPIPPTASFTPTPELLPIAGEWHAKGVNANWSMVFEITHDDGIAYFRVISAERFHCDNYWLTLKTWPYKVPFEDGNFRQDVYWSGQVISPERIEGAWNLSMCNLSLEWVGTIYKPETPSPLTPTP